jgi:hypothetical protein
MPVTTQGLPVRQGGRPHPAHCVADRNYARLFLLTSQIAFRARDSEKVKVKKKDLLVDLVFHISSTWLDESGTEAN